MEGFTNLSTAMAKADEDKAIKSGRDPHPVPKNSPQVIDDDDEDGTDIEGTDFVPVAGNDDAVSEESSDDADEDEDSELKCKTDGKKNRSKKIKRPNKFAIGKRKKSDRGDSDDESSDDSADEDFQVDSRQLNDYDADTSSVKAVSTEVAKAREEEEKAEMDRLWADFKRSVEADKLKKKDRSVEKIVTKLVDFAGEKVSVEEKMKVKVPNSTIPKPNEREVPFSSSQINNAGDSSSTSPQKHPVSAPPPRRRGGISILGNDPEAIGLVDLKKRGLSGLLSAFQNKSKSIGTLEKSKLDWDTFKRQKGFEEELQLHNKSKETFIDKQEFLLRADHRQFENEKKMRATQRSRRLAK